jgi:hypothetical protein
MSPYRVPVAVTMERRTLSNRWLGVAWRVAEVVADGAPGESSAAAHAERLDDDHWRYGGLAIELFRDEAEGYWLNLTASAPVIFVMWRLEDERAVPKIVTLSYNEAGRMLDGGEQVDNVPMPADLARWLAEFTEAHYRPEPKKRARPASFKGARRDE